MRLSCPYCGERDRREFTYKGAAVALMRPDGPEFGAQWDDYLHNRDNPAGETRDLWQHAPCGAWIEVTRNTVTHEVTGTRAVAEDPA
ncbi:MAG: sarcosine oxidase subunit delta [Pseudomonadota bacterium]